LRKSIGNMGIFLKSNYVFVSHYLRNILCIEWLPHLEGGQVHWELLLGGILLDHYYTRVLVTHKCQWLRGEVVARLEVHANILN
jgi:hypothetical protein